MDAPSAYDDWCNEVQANEARKELVKDALMLLRAFVRAREQGFAGDLRGIEEAIRILEKV